MAFDPDGLQPVSETVAGPALTIPIEVPEITEEPDDYEDVDTGFDEQYRTPFIGLLHLGHLTETFKLYGHKFFIETPTQRERLESGILHKEFVNTIADAQAWATIVVAVYLKYVDDFPLPQPLGPRETGIRDRFNWVQDNIRPEIVQEIFEYCLNLDAKVAETLQELENSAKA